MFKCKMRFDDSLDRKLYVGYFQDNTAYRVERLKTPKVTTEKVESGVAVMRIQSPYKHGSRRISLGKPHIVGFSGSLIYIIRAGVEIHGDLIIQNGFEEEGYSTLNKFDNDIILDIIQDARINYVKRGDLFIPEAYAPKEQIVTSYSP